MFKLAWQIGSSTLIVFIFIKMIQGYGAKRKDRCYSLGKRKAQSLRGFGPVSKSLFCFSFCVTMLSIWTDSAYIISLHNNLPTKAFGLLLLILGYLRLRRTFEQLGTNYSPIFDAYLPDSIVTTGMYKQIRHPVYLYNLFISFGLALTSGSVWVLASATIGLAFLIIGIEREEDYLKANFSQYNSYSETTWKLLPYLY